jgi:hypothetical protein
MEGQKTKSRSERLEESRVLIEELHAEIEARASNLSEKLRDSDEVSKISSTLDTLRQILNLMENIEFSSVP